MLLEVTSARPRLPGVLAAAGEGAPADPSIEAIEGWYRRLLEVAPGCNVQLSGGEPTARDDLPEVVALGRALGHGFLQLNTNGLRIAREPGYAERLAEAGLATVFLQFDGVDDAPYVALRGRPLAAVKEQAVLLDLSCLTSFLHRASKRKSHLMADHPYARRIILYLGNHTCSEKDPSSPFHIYFPDPSPQMAYRYK